MTQLENTLTLHTDPDRETEMMSLITVPNPLSGPKGKRKTGLVPLPKTSSKSSLLKKPRVTESPLL